MVAAAVVLASVAALAWFTAHARFTCPGVVWTIDYTGSDSGYLGNDPPTGCLGYPASAPAGFEIVILLTLTNTAPSVAHQVTSITVASPSSVNSISPALPIELSPTGSSSIAVAVTIPTLMGDYVVYGVISTS